AAVARAPPNRRQRLDNCVVRGSAAERPQPVQGSGDIVRRMRPAGQRLWRVIEREDEELVGAVEELEEEAIDRGARIRDPLAEHAVADVEQDAEADRHAIARELRDLLLDTVLEYLERLAIEPGNQPAFFVGHRRGDARQLDAGLKGTVAANERC